MAVALDVVAAAEVFPFFPFVEESPPLLPLSLFVFALIKLSMASTQKDAIGEELKVKLQDKMLHKLSTVSFSNLFLFFVSLLNTLEQESSFSHHCRKIATLFFFTQTLFTLVLCQLGQLILLKRTDNCYFAFSEC